MLLHEKLLANLDFSEKCSLIWQHYVSRKLDNELEPIWIHHPYELVKNYIDLNNLSQEQLFLLGEVIKSHTQKDGVEVPLKRGFPNENLRIMHDYWKAGSFTWIFMGRALCEGIEKQNGWIILSRTLPNELYRLLDSSLAPPTLFCAYRLDSQDTIGPAIYRENVLKEIKERENVV